MNRPTRMTVTAGEDINRVNIQNTKSMISHQQYPHDMRRQSLRQTAELYKKGTKVQ
jgi:hypothetical protein